MAADDYESKYMKEEGDVLHREKTVWKLHWILLFAPTILLMTSVLGMAGVVQDHGKPFPLAAAAVMLPLAIAFLALWAMFISLRVHVTTKEVHIQFGVFGPRIPIDRIDSVVVRDYPALALGGGIKRYDGAWAYTLWGQGTRFVRIEWHDESGGKNSTILWAQDPDMFAAIIEKARAGKQMRVDVPAETSELAEEVEGEEARARKS